MEYKECPILTATKKAGKASSNPCQNCAFFNNCLDDITRDMSEEMLSVAREHIAEMRKIIRHYQDKTSYPVT